MTGWGRPGYVGRDGDPRSEVAGTGEKKTEGALTNAANLLLRCQGDFLPGVEVYFPNFVPF
jgi:hypothetical protein